MLKYTRFLPCIVTLLVLVAPGIAQWRSIGPWGGNARALAYDPSDPDHILVGSGAGALFDSVDGGRHWRHFAHLGPGQELMLETIAFDPSRAATIYAGGWSVTGSGGGFFISRDGGHSWTEPPALRRKSIQALALSESAPGMLIAGALDGLYRSTDWGESWARITPENHPDLKNFESVAVDPRDPKIIYAGTWHLPWKSSDGGLHWSVIKQGVIDDSDVFSIVLDHSNPQTVFASACSGIYKSENGGQLFRKIQGIPGSARRTRVLQQDPLDSRVVYAGTTEGLWKTSDGGKSFKLITPPNYILNDVLVDPRNPRRVLIATDRGGVFASDDAGATFYASNDGFSERQISALIGDTQSRSDLYAAVLNDKEFGGVFHLHEGTWSQMSEGLGTLDVFDLAQSAGGQLLAATNRGLFRFDSAAGKWMPSRDVVEEKPALRGRPGRANAGLSAPPVVVHSRSEKRGSALALGRLWYAATDGGLLISANDGKSWTKASIKGQKEFIAVSSRGRRVAAASLRGVLYSRDEGEHWLRTPVPAWVSRIYSIAIAADGAVWIGTREGALRWTEGGKWEHVAIDVSSRETRWIGATGDLLLAAPAESEKFYVSRDGGLYWQSETGIGYEVTKAAMQQGKVYLVTRHHGLLAEEKVLPVGGQH